MIVPKTTNYPFKEQILDLVPHVSNLCESAIFGCFKRLIFFPSHFLNAFAPNSIAPWHRGKEITHKNSFSDFGLVPFFLTALLKKLEDLKKQMGIRQNIKIYVSDVLEYPGAAGSQFSKTDIVIFLPRDKNYLTPFGLSKEEEDLKKQETLDFLFAHELSHCLNNDIPKRLLLSTIILIGEIATAIFLGVLYIPLIEMISSLIENYYSRITENHADKTAMIYLNTNRGAIHFFETEIEKIKALRQDDLKEFLENRKVYFKKGDFFLRCFKRCFAKIFKDTMVSSFSPEGNNRNELTHFSWSSRKCAAINFRTKD